MDSQSITVHTVIIGGGQAGLAMSRCLIELSRTDHVILERGRVGERWRSSYWDSLHLLTPKWQSRLPGGCSYEGEDIDEFMTAREFVSYLEVYAQSFQAPIQTNVTVVGLEECKSQEDAIRYRVTSENGSIWYAKNVVIATGFCDFPRIPSFASNLPAFVQQIPAQEYKNPSQITKKSGKQIVLVVGAGASGIQIALELAEATKDDIRVRVVISVGRHCRWPRSYRGKDILWWMDQMGAFRALANQQEETTSPGPQLMGGKDHADASLYHLKRNGVEIVGKVTNITSGGLDFDNEGLGETLKRADDACIQLLQTIDSFAAKNERNPANTPDLTPPPDNHEDLVPRLAYQNCVRMDSIDLTDRNTSVTVIWATGFDRRYLFLSDSLTKRLWDPERSILRNQGGIVIDQPGLYVLGYRWLRTKGSSFVDGVGEDAKELAQHIVAERKGFG